MNIISGFIGLGKLIMLQCVFSGQILESEGKLYVLIIEDLVEYLIEGVVQIMVINVYIEEECLCLFLVVIFNVMWFDLDIIMIGEICDWVLVQNVLCVLMIGYQIWIILYVNSVFVIVDCFVDLGLQQSMVFDYMVIIGLISQCLVKQFCLYCK